MVGWKPWIAFDDPLICLENVVDIEIGLSGAARCSHCRSATVAVTVDSGVGRDLPLFVTGEAPAPASEKVVQAIREPLQGRLCLNCGLLTAQAKISRAEIDAYREQVARLSSPSATRPPVSSRSPTWIKGRPPSRQKQ